MNIDHARSYLNACGILLDSTAQSMHASAREVMQHFAKTLPPAWIAATHAALGL